MGGVVAHHRIHPAEGVAIAHKEHAHGFGAGAQTGGGQAEREEGHSSLHALSPRFL
jgi:hypothetical protein